VVCGSSPKSSGSKRSKVMQGVPSEIPGHGPTELGCGGGGDAELSLQVSLRQFELSVYHLFLISTIVHTTRCLFPSDSPGGF
jgi:hypothetical protein